MPVTYRFTLQYADQIMTLGTDQVKNWSDIKPGLQRNETLRGVVLQFTDAYQFVSAARRFIINAEDTEGVDAQLYLTVEIGNESGHRSSFRQIGDVLVANFAKTFINTENVATLSFDPSGFQQMVLNRWETKVSHNQLTSIDGVAIEGESDTTVPLVLHVRELDQTTKYTEGELYGTYYDGSAMTLPTTAEYFGDDHSFNQVQIGFNRVVNESLDHSFAFIQDVAFETIVNVLYDINVSFNRAGGVDVGFIHFLLTEGDSLGNNSEWIDLAEKDNNGLEDCQMTAVGSQQLTIPKGWNCFLVVRAYREGTSVNPTIKLKSLDMSMTSSPVIIDYPTTIRAIYPHEAIERNLQLITGIQAPLYAPCFGRDDNGYQYNGDFPRTMQCNGFMIRNFPYQSKPYISSLKDLLGSLQKIYNLVFSFKIVDNELKFVIEPYLDAFNIDKPDDELVELTEIDVIDRAPNEKMHYSAVKVGYKNQEYEEVNGVLPYNSEFEFAIPLKAVDNTLDLISEYRADDYGIEYARRKQYVNTPTTDTKYDSDNFMIRAVIGGGLPLICERDESFYDVTGIYSPNTAYNLNISPGRNLERWYPVINQGVYRKTNSFIKYMVAEKNSSLVTQKLDQPPLVEAADIAISSLPLPILLPYTITMSAKGSLEQWNQMCNNQNDPVKFATRNKGKLIPLYGIAEEGNYNPNTGMIENMKLTQVNR